MRKHVNLKLELMKNYNTKGKKNGKSNLKINRRVSDSIL